MGMKKENRKKKFLLIILCSSFLILTISSYNISNAAEEKKVCYLKITAHISFVETVNNVSFFVVKGLVQNNGTKNVVSTNVTAIFYKEDGKIAATSSTRTALKIIRAGEESPFQIYLALHSSPAPKSYKLRAIGLETNEEPYDFIKIKNVKSWIDKDGFHRVSGEVYNKGPLIAKSVRVICVYYDAEGKILVISDTVTDPISIIPGGRSHFDISSYPFPIKARRYDLFVSVRRYEKAASANWILFGLLITVTIIFLVYMKRKGW